MLHNTPEMVEAHYAVLPPTPCSLLNTRLDAPLLAWQMNHCETAVLPPTASRRRRWRRRFACCATARRTPVVIDVCDSEYTGPGERLGAHEYEALLEAHPPLAALAGPRDEWDAIAVSYTSGTTGDPKGVVTHHRGAYLNAVCNAATWTLPHFPRYVDAADVPLQRLVLSRPWRAGRHPSACAKSGGGDSMRSAASGSILRAAPIIHNLLIAAPRRCAPASPTRCGRWSQRSAAGVDDRGHGADRLRDHASTA
jgi:fatty-acyl-CoA synthase